MADEPKNGEKTPGKPSGMVEAVRIYDAVWRLVGSVGLGVGGGYLLDRKFGTLPWITLGGSVLGMVAGFVSFFRQFLGKSKSD